MAELRLSICVATRNRADYLADVLGREEALGDGDEEPGGGREGAWLRSLGG